MGQTVPYRTANRYITSTTELLALPGFGRDRYLKLAPFVTALPWGTKINVCTAHGVVLDAFIGASHTEWGNEENLVKARQEAKGCYPTLTDYSKSYDPRVWTGANPTPKAQQPNLPQGVGQPTPQRPQPQRPQGAQSKFGQTSSFFRLTSVVTIGSTEFNLYSLLYQDANVHMVRAVQRSFTPD
jgi:general secretion pathway protein K